MATVATTPRSTTLTLASATAGPFDIGFRIFAEDGVRVYLNGVLNEDYTVTTTLVNGYDDSATITFDTALEVADVVVIDGLLAPGRSDDYLASDGQLTKKLNIDLGRNSSVDAEARRDIDRSVRGLSAMEPLVPETGRVLSFDTDLNPIMIDIDVDVPDLATEDQAVAGLDNTTTMTPLRNYQADRTRIITDWNSAVANGRYEGVSAANGPVAGWFMGNVTRHSNESNFFLTQEVWEYTDATGHYDNKWVRSCVDGVWNAWVQVVDTLATQAEAQTGTNAFRGMTPLRTREAIDYLGHAKSVKTANATGDGSTDDAAAFTTAASLVGSGGVIDVPDGTYNLGSNVTTTGRFWNLRGLIAGAGLLLGSTVAWVKKRGEPVTLDMVFGGFLSHVTYYSRQATAHLDSRATVAIQRREVGSSANGPANAGYALILNSEKEDFLTSAVEGELDGQYIIARQGQKSDVGGILIDIAKVGGDSGGSVAIEAASQWIDSSGTLVNRIQTIKGFLGQTSAFYGVTGTSSIGFWAEAQTGPSFAAFMADQVGSGATFENFIYFTTGRDVANVVYYVDGTGRTYAPNATAALPAYSFVNDPDSGLARIAADTLGLVTGGAARVYVNNNGLAPGVADTTALGAYTSRFGSVYANGVYFGAASTNVLITSGTGSPEGAVAAGVGSLYTRTDGGTGTTLYVKESGTGNTGWVAK